MGQITSFQERYVLPWEVITANQVGVINSGYIANSGGTLTVSLPTVCSVGDVLAVSSMNGMWQITQAAGQQIQLIGTTTTAGAGGTITSTAVGDSIWLVCNVANTNFIAMFSSGILTVV